MNQAVILLAFLSLVVLFIAFLISRNYISAKAAIVIYVVSIFVTALLYTPGYGSDLGRYFIILDSMRGIPINKCNYYGVGTNLFTINFIFWVIANIGFYKLLPALVVSTVFGIGAYITIDCSIQRKQTKYMGFFLLLQFMQLPFFGIMDNVRNVWAFSLVILAVYRDTIQDKKNLCTLLLYILPCFMHDGVYLLVLFRFFIPIAKKLRYVLPIIALFVGTGINMLYMHISVFPSFIANSIKNSYQYLNNSVATDWIMYVRTSPFFILQRNSEMFIAVLMILFLYLIQKNMDKSMSQFSYFAFLILISVLACNVFAAPHYWRYYSASMLCIPAIINYSFSINNRNVLVTSLRWIYVLSSFLMFALNIWRTYGAY